MCSVVMYSASRHKLHEPYVVCEIIKMVKLSTQYSLILRESSDSD